MITIKKLLLSTIILTTCVFTVLGVMNSIIVDKRVFLNNDLNIKFAKRLDDISGEFVVGRTAASIPQWSAVDSIAPAKVIPKKKAKSKHAIQIAQKVKTISSAPVASNAPRPAVENTPDLELTGGFYNKQPMKNGAGFKGSARVTNGVIEGLDVTLPDGNTFSIDINERMIGNVFKYEDSETRELKSGLFYKVRQGSYMLTLTDDSKYNGMRLEFKSQNAIATASTELATNTNWNMNNQNQQNQEVIAQNENEQTYSSEESNEEIEQEFPQAEQRLDEAGYEDDTSYQDEGVVQEDLAVEAEQVSTSKGSQTRNIASFSFKF